MKRRIYTVQPAKGSAGKLWDLLVKRDDGETYFVGASLPRKADQVALGRRLARGMWEAQGKPSQLRVKGRNGRIQTEHTYGADPKRTKG